MKIVTAGRAFLDIDAYAGCVAYAELLNLQGIEAVAYSTAIINESVTKTIQSWGLLVSDSYITQPGDMYVLIDVSEPEFIEKTVPLNGVEEVIDHHVGFETYWHERIGEKSSIEFIGAACTLVYEKWKQSGLAASISKTSARLLIAGILDNTLNFKAAVTTPRDELAYRELLESADLPEDWAATYFSECQAAIFEDLSTAILNDTKTMTFTQLDKKAIAVGQLVVWDGSEMVARYQSEIVRTLTGISDQWFANIVSISEGKSYLMSGSPEIRDWAARLLRVQFNGSIAEADRLWLRKEIVKKDYEL